MNQLIFLFVSMTLLFSCMNQPKKVVTIHSDSFFKEVFEIKEDSVKHGSYEKFYANDLLAEKTQYVDGRIHGERKLYAQDGYLEISENYENGLFHGPYKTFYPEGTLKKEQNYVDNKIQGELKEYHPNGNLKALIQFIDNYENGPFTEFHTNGKKHWEGFYANGDFEQDTLKEYDKTGILIRKLFCEKGVCQTVWTPEKGYIAREKIFDKE